MTKIYVDFSRKLAKLAIQIKDNYYINWKNTRIRKILGKTDNRKTMIILSFDDFSAPRESLMFIFWLFRQFTPELYTYAILTLLNHGII